MSLSWILKLMAMNHEYRVNRYVGQPDEFGGGVDTGGIAVTNPYVALAQLAGGLYDSWRNRQVAKENTDKTIAAQKSEAELAYQRAVEMWNAKNLYDSPANQMARFGEGGLNPHLIYGQGSPGNSGPIPQYQPANLQYRYEAPAYGSVIQSLIPTLMSVGTWMQNMRLSQAELDNKTTNTERTRQLIEFLIQRNPQLLTEGSNRLSLFPYQESMISYQSGQARQKLHDMSQEFRYKYGEDLWQLFGAESTNAKIGGTRRLEFMQQQARTEIDQTRARWSEYGVTDPQNIVQMVLGAVMNLASSQLRLSTHRRR